MQNKVRQSNMELLRLIAMFLVLVVHANYFSLGVPTWNDILANPVSTSFKIIIQSISVMSVNLFVLISGYFSIKLKLKSIINFFYIILFYSIISYFSVCIIGIEEFTIIGFINSLRFFSASGNWFILSYFGLMLFSPMVNKFLEQVTQKELGLFIVSITLFQIYFSFVWRVLPDFNNGYSILSFINIYCIGRYLHLYRLPILSMPQSMDAICWLIFVILIVICAILIYAGVPIPNVFAYNSPLVIGASIYFFLFFSKLSFQSKVVNKLAVSAFSVFLVHCNINLVSHYIAINKVLIESSIIFVFLFLIFVFFASIAIDQIRIFTYSLLNKCFCRFIQSDKDKKQ